jgi:hypothetical protein
VYNRWFPLIESAEYVDLECAKPVGRALLNDAFGRQGSLCSVERSNGGKKRLQKLNRFLSSAYLLFVPAQGQCLSCVPCNRHMKKSGSCMVN